MALAKRLSVPASLMPIDDPFIHHYDQHPTREDLMGESVAQSNLAFYIRQVLMWMYHQEDWFIATNLNIYQYRRKHEYPLAPDVAIFKGIVLQKPNHRSMRSWRLYLPGHPPPQVVFEISSEKTWKKDLTEKPAQYAALGVQEYYAYEPNDPPYWRTSSNLRLRGWHRSEEQMHEVAADAHGRIWSPELDSWLMPDGGLLRFTDSQGEMRRTEAEAHLMETEAAYSAKEKAWAKLRELGIDPETL